MVRITTLAFGMGIGMLCLCLTGCGSISDYRPLGSGYIWVTHTENSFSEPSASQFELQYSPGEGKWWKKVWPDVYGGIAVTNGVAVFIGEKASKKRQHFYERWPLEDRIFAVKAPDRPLDITDEVLWRWSKESGGDFERLLKTASIARLKGKDNGVEFYFVGFSQPIRSDFHNPANRISVFSPVNVPVPNIQMDWNQIADVMREVKENGVERKDLRWGTRYIEKEFKPEPSIPPSPATH